MKITSGFFEDECCHFKFNISNYGLNMTVFIQNPFSCTKNEWIDLYNSISEEKFCRLTINNDNKSGLIRCDENNISLYSSSSRKIPEMYLIVDIPIKYKKEFLSALEYLFNDSYLDKFWQFSI